MQKLKDCPFCGARPLFEGLRVMEEMDGECSKVFVECSACGARGPVKSVRFDLPGSLKIESAAMLWNARRSKVARDTENAVKVMDATRPGNAKGKELQHQLKRGV